MRILAPIKQLAIIVIMQQSQNQKLVNICGSKKIWISLKNEKKTDNCFLGAGV